MKNGKLQTNRQKIHMRVITECSQIQEHAENHYNILDLLIRTSRPEDSLNGYATSVNLNNLCSSF